MKSKHRLLALFLTLLLLVAPLSATAEGETLLEKILTPDVGAKPMVRLWLPDAGAGYIEEDGSNYLWMAEQYIQELYDAGIGGVELTIVSDGSDLFYENGQKYGWGTDAHVRLLKTFVATANEMPDGFIVDITITAHWPVVINTIDPNDVEQQQELLSVYQKLTASDVQAALESGTLELALPPQRTLDFNNNAQLQSPFFFVSRLQGAVAAKVTAVEDGVPTQVEFASLEDMHGEAGEAIASAGVPGAIVDSVTGETVELEDGMVVEVLDDWKSYTVRDDLYTINRADQTDTNYAQSDIGTIVAVNEDGSHGEVVYEHASWSPDAEYGNNIMPIFNMDMWADAERMNDEQLSYHIDAETLAAYLEAQGVTAEELNDDEEIQVGDYVLVNCYTQGTGQIQSGGAGVCMNPKYYAVDYFNADGVQKVIDYWNENMLYWMETEDVAEEYAYPGMDSTLADLLKVNAERSGNASCIFEDSIEAHFAYSQWCIDALDEYSEMYGEDLTTCLPIITGLGVNGDEGKAGEVLENYHLMLGTLYDEEHAQVINNWTKDFGYSYRAQAYSLTGLDVTASAIAVNVPEGDNSTVGDGLRTLRASVNMSDKRYLSMESLTFGYESFLEWTPISMQINSDFSDGVNRVIFHGSPFNRAYEGDFKNYNSQYPGWSWGFMAWNSRQLWWDYADGITDYIASVQALLQNGTNKVEIAVIKDVSENFHFTSGDAYDLLMDNGYAYNIMSEQAFLHANTAENAIATDGMIYPDGPAYKEVIVDGAQYISGALVDKLTQFADAGVSILFVGDAPTEIYGSESYEGEQAHIAEGIEALLARDNVAQIERATEPVEQEAPMPGPFGAQETLTDETVQGIVDFVKEQGVEPYASYLADGLQTTVEYDEADGSMYYYLYNDSGAALETEVALSGNGEVYVIDAYTCEVEKADNCAIVDGRHVLTVSLKPNEFAILAVSDNAAVFPADEASETYTQTAAEPIAFNEGWTLTIEDHTPRYTKEEIAADTQLNPSLTDTVTQELGAVDLVTWDQLPLTQEQLDTFGKDSPGRLAGLGTYRKTIELRAEQIGDYAVLHFEKPDATNILRVTVNGETYTSINAVTLDLKTDKLVEGANEIEILVGTGGANIAEFAPVSFGGGGPTVPEESTEYGLTGFSITACKR